MVALSLKKDEERVFAVTDEDKFDGTFSTEVTRRDGACT